MSRRVISVERALGQTLGKLHLKKEFQKYSALSHWKEIVGEKLSKNCKVERIIRSKILVIRVLNAVWAQEIMLKREEIIEKFNFHSDSVIVEDLRVVSGNPTDF